MALRHEIGTLGESLAERFLVERGCRLIERNARVDGDELDLVVQHGSTIVAVEVKTTSNGADPFEAVDDEKLHRIHRAVEAYPSHIGRIDVVAVSIGGRGATIHWVQSMG
ncbi:MAG: YraN family protein [Actinomycetota bacterium]